MTDDVVWLAVKREDGTRLTVEGREAWALFHLIGRGALGVTPIDRPAPRWSDYIFKLRARGLEIQALREGHGGSYAGHHGRYVLHDQLVVEDLRRAKPTRTAGPELRMASG